METIDDLLTYAEERRRSRVYEEYRRRLERVPADLPVVEETPAPTSEPMPPLQAALRLADPARALEIRHLLRFLMREYLEDQVQPLRQELYGRQQRAVISAEILEEEVPLPQVSGRLAAERKRVVRDLLEEAATTVISGFDEMQRRVWSRLFALATSVGYPNLLTLWEECSGLDLDAWLQPLEGILRETEYTYRESMQWFLKRMFGIRLEAARRHDILALFGMGLDEATAWFPRTDLIPCLEQWLADWGWKAEEHADLHLEHPTGVLGGAWCAPLSIPGDIRLALAPAAGMRGYAQALRETGQALLLASFDAEVPKALRCFPDPSLLEAAADLYGELVRTRRWLEIYRQLPQPGEVLRLAHLERLFIVRRYIGKCVYERTLYEDATLEGKDEAYRDALRRACGFSYPPAYYLYDVDPGFPAFWSVRGWLLSAHLRHQLHLRYADEWFREPDAFAALAEFWARSPSHTVEALVEQVGGANTDVTPVVADLLREL